MDNVLNIDEQYEKRSRLYRKLSGLRYLVAKLHTYSIGIEKKLNEIEEDFPLIAKKIREEMKSVGDMREFRRNIEKIVSGVTSTANKSIRK